MQATIEAGFSGYVSNIRASTKKSIAYKKSVYMKIMLSNSTAQNVFLGLAAGWQKRVFSGSPRIVRN